MEIRGRIIKKLPLQSGTSQSGSQWAKQEYVLETEGQYPKKVFFDFFGDKIVEYALEEGQNVVIRYDLESREHNGKWYTSVRAWHATIIN